MNQQVYKTALVPEKRKDMFIQETFRNQESQKKIPKQDIDPENVYRGMSGQAPLTIYIR